MTAQRTDTIIINGDEHVMYSLPLELYWEKNNNRPSLISFNTGLNRGYYAKWLIEKNKLYLIDFYGENGFPLIKEYSLPDLFPLAKDKIFADWFSGDIRIPMGKQVHYSHSAWGSEYELTTTLLFQNGVIVDSGSFVI